MVIPLIPDGKRPDAARDGVVGKVLVGGGPNRVDRPADLKVAADPFEELRPQLIRVHLGGKMQAGYADTSLGQLLDFFLMILRHVALEAVAIQHHGVGLIIAGPGPRPGRLRLDVGDHIGAAFVQAAGQ